MPAASSADRTACRAFPAQCQRKDRPSGAARDMAWQWTERPPQPTMAAAAAKPPGPGVREATPPTISRMPRTSGGGGAGGRAERT